MRDEGHAVERPLHPSSLILHPSADALPHGRASAFTSTLRGRFIRFLHSKRHTIFITKFLTSACPSRKKVVSLVHPKQFFRFGGAAEGPRGRVPSSVGRKAAERRAGRRAGVVTRAVRLARLSPR